MDQNRPAAIVLLALGLALGGAVHGDSPTSRETALALARSVDTGQVRQQLLDWTVAGSTADVLGLLEHTSQRDDWPAAAVDAALHDFAQELRRLPRTAVPPEVLTWLGAYRPRAWVAHEDHAASLVPLFNVRGVAAGVENDWRRQDALLEGLALVASNPRSLVDAWLIERHPASRLGYLQALAQANPDQLREVGRDARRRLDAHPELTALAGQAALRDADVPALGEVLALGSGPDLTTLMRQAARQLPAEASAALLDSALATGSGLTAALAIAELAPAAAGFASTQELLIAQLEDQQLGPTAALALSRVASPGTLSVLQHLATGDDSKTKARNARLALDLRESTGQAESPR